MINNKTFNNLKLYYSFLKTNTREKILKMTYNLTTSKKNLLKHLYSCGFAGCNTTAKIRLQPTYNSLQPQKHLQPFSGCNMLKIKRFALGCRL